MIDIKITAAVAEYFSSHEFASTIYNEMNLITKVLVVFPNRSEIKNDPIYKAIRNRRDHLFRFCLVFPNLSGSELKKQRFTGKE